MKFILVLLGLWLLYYIIVRVFGPVIRQWVLRRTINMFARRAGFDEPLKSSKKKSRRNTRPSGRRSPSASGSPIIPKEYAEDVEFTEIRTYSEETAIGKETSDGRDPVVEEQVSDAEIIEIVKKK